MCKHVLNAQVSIRAPCCRKWFDCAKCHAEAESHELKRQFVMTFGCKQCKKVFTKDMRYAAPRFMAARSTCTHTHVHARVFVLVFVCSLHQRL